MDESLDTGLPVKGPSGAVYTVLNDDEVKVFEGNVKRYLKDNHFQNVSDLKDLDRIVSCELMCWRWANWLSQDQDYEGSPIDSTQIQKQIKEFSAELRLIKKSLGMDKGSRDKDKGESLAEYITTLSRRAKEFGYHREEQLTKALILFNELSALVQLHVNCTEDEQHEMHVAEHDVIAWVRDVAIPEYKKLDDYFTHNKQRSWIRDL